MHESQFANEPGDWIEGEMTLLFPEDDGLFCQRSALAAERIYLYAFPVDEGAVSTPGHESSLWISLLKCRIRLDDAVDSVLSQRDAGLVKAILFGEKTRCQKLWRSNFEPRVCLISLPFPVFTWRSWCDCLPCCFVRCVFRAV